MAEPAATPVSSRPAASRLSSANSRSSNSSFQAGSASSISSSLASPDGSNTPLMETRPPISSRPSSSIILSNGHADSPVRLTGGFASLRVGLGSPRMGMDLRNVQRRQSGGAILDTYIQEETSAGPSNIVSPRPHGDQTPRNFVDQLSGLPSPPFTEMGATQALAYTDVNKSTSSLPRSTSTSSTASLQPKLVKERTASAASSSSSSRKLRPRTSTSSKASPSLSRSNSTSSALNETIRPSASRITSGRQSLPPPAVGRSPSPLHVVTEGTDRRRLSDRGDSGEAKDRENVLERRRTVGNDEDDVDKKIREAEAKIKDLDTRRGKPTRGSESSPSKSQSNWDDSHPSGSNLSPSDTDTVRRVQRPSTASRNGDMDSPESTFRNDPERSSSHLGLYDRNEGSGRRKPLPSEFRRDFPFTPSPRHQGSTAYETQSLTSPTEYAKERTRRSNAHPSPLSARHDLPDHHRVAARGTYHSLERSVSTRSALDRSASLRKNSDPASQRYRPQSQINGDHRFSTQDFLDHRGLPLPRSRLPGRDRAESVIESPSDRNPVYSRDSNLQSKRSSRLLLTPQDSISAVGAASLNDRAQTPTSYRSVKKDPLDVIRRMEEQRNDHNQHWDQERAASVLEIRQRSPEKSPGRFERNARPATSMSNLRDEYRTVPSTAPIDRTRRWSPEVISPTRVYSRIANSGPSTEPRNLRSQTSLSMRPSTALSAGLDPASSTTEHGRLMLEALRALELKLSPEVLASQPELLRTFISAAKNAETMNVAARNADDFIARIFVRSRMGELGEWDQDIRGLAPMIEQSAKTSDQSIRDLTRIMLDLPKLLRGGSRITASTSNGSLRGLPPRRTESISSHLSSELPRRWQPTSPRSTFVQNGLTEQSPLSGRPSARHSIDMLRPSTSIGDIPSPMRHRDSLSSVSSISRHQSLREPRSSAAPSLPSRLRGITPRKEAEILAPIEASPPSRSNSRVPSAAYTAAVEVSSSSSGSIPTEIPLPKRQVLRKKTSTASTNTIRAGSTFLPSSFGKATTAVSVINAGSSPRSIRNWRSGIEDFGDEAQISPLGLVSLQNQQEGNSSNKSSLSPENYLRRSRTVSDANHHHDQYSYDRERSESSNSGGWTPNGLGDGNDIDAVAFLEQKLALAAKTRDEEREREEDVRQDHSIPSTSLEGNGSNRVSERKLSLTERFRATIRGNR